MILKFIFLCSSECVTFRCGLCLTCQSGVMSSHVSQMWCHHIPKHTWIKSWEKLRVTVLMDLTVCAVQLHLIRVDGRALESQRWCVRVLQKLASGLPSLASHCLWKALVRIWAHAGLDWSSCSFMRMFYVWRRCSALELRAALVYHGNQRWWSDVCAKIPEWLICFGFWISWTRPRLPADTFVLCAARVQLLSHTQPLTLSLSSCRPRCRQMRWRMFHVAPGRSAVCLSSIRCTFKTDLVLT